jgi:hypothetical protein
MVEISKALETIETTDKKIDKNDQVDEQAIFKKIEETDKYFETFENTKLKELESTLNPIQFQKLQNEFSRLKS